MKKSLCSMDELLSCCCNSELRNGVKILVAPFYSTACPAIVRPGRAPSGDALPGVSAYSSNICA